MSTSWQCNLFLFLLDSQLLDAPLGLKGIGVEIEGFLIVADGSIGHVLMFTLLTQQDILGSKPLQQVVTAMDFRFKFLDAILLTGDDGQLAADETLDLRLFNIVARMDSHEEILQESIEVLTVKGCHRIMILLVGFALVQGLAHELAVIVALGKLDHLWPYKDVAAMNGFLENDAIE